MSNLSNSELVDKILDKLEDADKETLVLLYDTMVNPPSYGECFDGINSVKLPRHLKLKWFNKLSAQRLYRSIYQCFNERYRITNSAQDLLTEYLQTYIYYLARDASCVLAEEGKRVMISDKDVINALKRRKETKILKCLGNNVSCIPRVMKEDRNQLFRGVNLMFGKWIGYNRGYDKTRDLLVNIFICRARDVLEQAHTNMKDVNQFLIADLDILIAVKDR